VQCAYETKLSCDILQGIPKRQLEDPRITKNYRMSGPPVSDRSAEFCCLQILYVPGFGIDVNLMKQNMHPFSSSYPDECQLAGCPLDFIFLQFNLWLCIMACIYYHLYVIVVTQS